VFSEVSNAGFSDQESALIRQDFPLFASKTYLNSCSYGVLCHAVEKAFNDYLQTRHREGSHWEHWVGKLEEMRAVTARLLDCSAADVSISSSLSESVNALASSLFPQGDRDTVVVTDFDFPTTSQIWLAQQRRGLRIVRVASDASGTELPLDRFDELIDERTLLVSVPYVCYRNGVKTDLKPIIQLAHDRGAKVLVDAYQAIGSVPLSATELGADFIAGGCLKYLLGTAGLAFMYVRNSESESSVPTTSGWFAQEDVHAMDIYHNDPARAARRFESGTPNVSGLYACIAGIEYLMGVGLERVFQQVAHLTSQIAAEANSRGWKLSTPSAADRHGAMMAIACTDAPLLVKRLAKQGIVASDRDNNLRVSPHFYNHDADIQTLFSTLEKNAELLVKR
jgi:selenocysteine lyase/cysteine desulfurase